MIEPNEREMAAAGADEKLNVEQRRKETRDAD